MSQVSFTVSTRPTTQQHRNTKARPTSTWRGTANPKCLTCSRAKRCKRREVAPNSLQQVSHTDRFTRQAPIDNNTRLTGGIHFDSTSFRVKTPNKLTGKAGGKEEKQWTRVDLDARFLGSHWVQVLLTLDQGLDLEGHKSSASSVSQGIQRSGALYCIVSLRPKSIYVLFFPYSGQSIPKPGPKRFMDSFLKQHRKILGWAHKQIKAKTPFLHKAQKDPQKTYAHKKSVTANTSVIQKSKHDSWVMGINLAVKLHASDGKQDQVSVSTTPHWPIFCRKSDNILWQYPGHYQDLRFDRTLNLFESSSNVALHSNTLLLAHGIQLS